MCYGFCSEIHRLQEQMGITDFFDNGKTKECVRFAALSQVDCLKVKILVRMCKSWLKALKTWMSKVEVIINFMNCSNMWITKLFCYFLWRKQIFVVCLRHYFLGINSIMSHDFSRISRQLDIASKSQRFGYKDIQI